MLRHATRVAGKSIDSRNDVSSPLKRRHESLNFRNNSCRVAASLIKPLIFQPQIDTDLCDTENFVKKLPAHKTKNIPAKRVMRQTNVLPKATFKKTLDRQTKGKRNKVIKSTQKSLKTQGHSKMLDNHVHQLNKPLKRVENYSKLGYKSPKHTKCFKSSDRRKHMVDEELLCSHQPANLDEEYISCAALKSMKEASELLNYSPESMFLRRMKLRLQKSSSKPVNKDCSKVNKLCACGNIHSTVSESDHLHSETHDSCRRRVSGGSDSSQEMSNDNILLEKDSVIREDNFTDQVKSRVCAVEKNPKQSADASTEITFQKSTTSVRKNSGCKLHCDVQAEQGKFQNVSKNRKSAPGNITILSNKCVCKKEIGGLCCCEVAHISDEGIYDLNDKESSAAFKSSLSAPMVPCLKSCKAKNIKCFCLDGSKSTHWADRRVSGVQTTGYDVVAGLLANDREKLTSDPCAKQVEELSNFRQKHWFDCHAHPHGEVDTMKHCHQINSVDCDLLQPTTNPCIRSFQLNQRLFSRAVADTHNEKCCLAALGDCVSSPLLPTQRRLITLPLAPEQNVNKKRANSIFTTLHTYEATYTGHPHNKLTTTSATVHARVPLPKNSLALRFQKGVSKSKSVQT